MTLRMRRQESHEFRSHLGYNQEALVHDRRVREREKEEEDEERGKRKKEEGEGEINKEERDIDYYY